MNIREGITFIEVTMDDEIKQISKIEEIKGSTGQTRINEYTRKCNENECRLYLYKVRYPKKNSISCKDENKCYTLEDVKKIVLEERAYDECPKCRVGIPDEISQKE